MRGARAAACFHTRMRSSAVALLLAASSVALLAVSAEACGGTTSSGDIFDGGSQDGGGVDSELPDARGFDAGVSFDEPLSVFGAYAVQKIFLGETLRTGAVAKDAWKQYGENIDGIVSTRQGMQGECKLRAGADSSKREDGNNGIDNAFGRTVLGFILGLVPTPTKTANDEIANGGRTTVFNLLPAAASSPARVGFLTATSTPAAPRWDGADLRSASESSVTAAFDNAKSTSTQTGMKGRIVASGIATGKFYLEIPLRGATWRVPIDRARMTMTISADNVRGSVGTLSGIIPAEEMVAELDEMAGRISTQLCSGSTLDAIRQTILQASDILLDGSQDPTKECNAISIGVGFEATKVTPSGVAADPPPGPDPCGP